jgi:ABC-type uncharacterized transport system involved in gliding motility auxiliary subunit
MNSRQKNLASTTLSVTLALLCYLLLLAVSNDNQKSFDMTADRRFSFSKQTNDIVGNLDFPVKLYAFLDPQGSSQVIEDLLGRYRRLNAKSFSFEVVDLEKNPTLAESMEVRAYGQGVLEKVGSKGPGGIPRRERILAFDEASITNALLKLSTTEERKVAFLTGHGERAFVGGAKDSLSTFGTALGTEGYKAEGLKLTEVKSVPKDIAVLVLAGPTSPLLQGEKVMLDAYLKSGGKLLFLADIRTPDSYVEWLKGYGFELKDSVIIDQASEMAKAEPVFAIGAAYSGSHPITKGFADFTAFRLSRPVEVGTASPLGEDGGPPQLEVLVSTAKSAFTLPIKQVLASPTVSLRADPKNASSLPLAVAGLYPRKAPSAEAPATPAASPTPSPEAVEISARMVVVGNTDSFTNALFALVSNRDFILNTVNWLAQSENQITVRSKNPKSQPLILEKQKQRWMTYLFGLLIPFLCVLTGLLISYGRRRGPAR